MLPTDLAAKAFRSSLIAETVEIVIDGPQLTRSEAEEASKAAFRIVQLLCEECERRYLDDPAGLALALGFTLEDFAAYTWSGVQFHPDTMLRVDLIRTGTDFRICEFNIGSSIGGLVQSSLPTLLSLPQESVPLKAWTEFVSSRLPSRSSGAIVEDDLALPKMRNDLNVLAAQIAKQCDSSVRVCSQRELERRPAGLFLHDIKVDWVYPLFFCENVSAHKDTYGPLREALQAGTVLCPFSQSDKILSSKGTLAILSSMGENSELLDEDRDLLNRWLAHTVLMSATYATYALANKGELVLKPSLGYSGRGVVVGVEVTESEWESVVDDACNGRDQYVLQRFYPSNVDPIVVCNYDGQVAEYMGRAVWGIYLFGGVSSCIPLLRTRPISGSAVINYGSGGAAGGLPFAHA